MICYALIDKATGDRLTTYATPPNRISLPSQPEGALVMGDDLLGWESDDYRLDQVTLPDPVPPPATVVSASQAKLVLDDDGIYEAVQQVCTNHPVMAVRIFWESANQWGINNPYVQAIGAEFNLNEAAIADMFTRASLK